MTHTYDADYIRANAEQLRAEDRRNIDAFRACHCAPLADEPWGDPVGYGRTPADDRARPTLLQRIAHVLTAKYRRVLA